MVIIGVYRPPRAVCGEYQLLLEKELSEICNWASLKSNHVVVIGDLNLDRMRPDKSEGKLLLDLEVEQGFDCLITKPTRTEKRGKIITESLIDVLLSNRATVRLLESYLCDRNYREKIGDLVSSSRTVNQGCPQGSALGPLLWNIFQNDLSYCVTTNLAMYADDHQIYHTGRDQSSVMLMLKESAQQATNE